MKGSLDAAVPALTVRRLPPSEWSALADGTRATLGSLVYGVLDAAHAKASGADAVHATVLSPAGPMVDAWCSDGPLVSGRCGDVHWRHNSHWLYGAIELDETVEREGLAALAQRAYGDVFATLDRTGFAHPLRLWNYLPGINADGGGMERYRQFNSGRQIAFRGAGRSAFDGPPAACAIGTRAGPFCVRFLAGRVPAVPLENPRQVPAYRYPAEYGPRSPTFSRAALVDVGAGQLALLISGTASIVGHMSMHAGDVAAQTRETLVNLQEVIAVAQARGTARFDLSTLECVVYVRHAEHLPQIRTVLEGAVGAQARAVQTAVYLEADICRSDLLIEMEAHAMAPGRMLT
ncbi:hypothetical protein [Piscinibacter sp.]|uniref:chorismate transformation enzyme, FkbO/Hyg5 family n=1 Tax=Piscinibacter sp. TaxID=1903157 RepID=UPI002C6AB435|nr:hypothetical protein [Albitalea sp.]HUG21375.1 hypothetical protein [Albitalea sp.]